VDVVRELEGHHAHKKEYGKKSRELLSKKRAGNIRWEYFGDKKVRDFFSVKKGRKRHIKLDNAKARDRVHRRESRESEIVPPIKLMTHFDLKINFAKKSRISEMTPSTGSRLIRGKPHHGSTGRILVRTWAQPSFPMLI
jgi:hypothetical protein